MLCIIIPILVILFVHKIIRGSVIIKNVRTNAQVEDSVLECNAIAIQVVLEMTALFYVIQSILKMELVLMSAHLEISQALIM